MSKKKKSMISIGIVCVIVILTAATVFFGKSKADADNLNSVISEVNFDSSILVQLKELSSADKEIIVSGARDGKIYVYSSDLEKKMEFDTAHNSEIHSISISPDRELIVSGDKSGKVLVWNLKNQSVNELKDAHKDDIKDIAFSPDGSYFATASKDRTIRIWDAKTLNGVHALKGHKSYVTCVDFSPKGDILASVGIDNKLILWDVNSGAKLEEKGNSHYRAVNQVKFSPDGRYLYTGSADTIIKVWDVEKLECVNSIKGHVNEILSLAAAPEGNTVVSAGRDKALYYFDVQTGEKIASIDFPDNVYVSGIKFSKDGTRMYIGDMSGELTCVDYKNRKVLIQKKLEPVSALTVF